MKRDGRRKRDRWCTPLKVARRLPLVDLDPCSNPRSHVRARRKCMLEHGEDGLLVSWRGLSVFVNPPFSLVNPFADKIVEARTYCYLTNEDSSTEWWRTISQYECYQLSFYDRLMFGAPKGIESSQNNNSQVMTCDGEFYSMIKDAFKSLGQWWKKI